MAYKFVILDPRNIPAATAANDAVFVAGSVYGIEVTVPALASRCTFNLDPQHSGGDANRAAIEDALTAELPPEGGTLATVRADLDSVGAMAIFSLRERGAISLLLEDKSAKGYCPACGMGNETMPGCCMVCGYREGSWYFSYEFMRRLFKVAASDKFARGGYPGPKPLPTRDNPWDERTASAESSRPLAAIAAAVAEFKLPLDQRVALMEKWLLTGEEPEQYRTQVEKEHLDMITALESGAIKYETRRIPYGNCPGMIQEFSGVLRCDVCMTEQPEEVGLNQPCGAWFRTVAVVESTHRAATSVGYSLAPVVIARNPAFKLGGGEAHVKYTVCAFEPKFADIKSALAELATLEAGWGGSPTIGGSPQGVSSILTVDQVVAVVEKHLK